LVNLRFYGGVDEIGGNRILVEDKDTRIFLDFGMSFSKCAQFFEEYLKPRYSCTGLKDLLTLRLLHFIDGIYRSDLLRLLGRTPHSQPSIKGVVLSHVHQDHSAYISLLDPRIAVYCSEVTKCYAKSAIEAGHRCLETEVYNFKERPLVDTRAPAIPRQFKLLDNETPVDMGSIKVKPFAVDHSVPGAMSFLIYASDATIAYTGDLRLHGAHGDLTKRFVDEAAKDDVDILLCEGTRVDEQESSSEEYVAENANKVIAGCRELVVADYAYKDLDRFLTFYNIAKNNDRKIAISKRHAYLLNELSKLPNIRNVPSLDDENILIYLDRKDTGQYSPSDYIKWEREFLGRSNTRDANWIHDHQDEVVASLTFFDVNELIDINPSPGSVYIHSSSEPHNEEQIIDQARLDCWLSFFGLAKYHFHASGHASGQEIRNIIETINPKKVIPIHTEKAELFQTLHANIEKPRLEDF
jgi:ribonuclease J